MRWGRAVGEGGLWSWGMGPSLTNHWAAVKGGKKKGKCASNQGMPKQLGGPGNSAVQKIPEQNIHSLSWNWFLRMPQKSVKYRSSMFRYTDLLQLRKLLKKSFFAVCQYRYTCIYISVFRTVALSSHFVTLCGWWDVKIQELTIPAFKITAEAHLYWY